MKKSDLTKFKKILENQLHQLQHDYSREPEVLEHNSALPDINDQASLESERTFELRIRDRERKLIAKVQGALRKIADGSYGVCESCGDQISVKRLEARPVTGLCINCKAEMEEEERREETAMKSRGSGSQPGAH